MAPNNAASTTPQDQSQASPQSTDWAALAAKYGGTIATPPSSSAPPVSDPNTPQADKPPVVKAPADATQKVVASTQEKDWGAAAAKYGGAVATPQKTGIISRGLWWS